MSEQPEIKPLIVEGAVDVSRMMKWWEMRYWMLTRARELYLLAPTPEIERIAEELIKEIESI